LIEYGIAPPAILPGMTRRTIHHRETTKRARAPVFDPNQVWMSAPRRQPQAMQASNANFHLLLFVIFIFCDI
jgi:hypothetical protein